MYFVSAGLLLFARLQTYSVKQFTLRYILMVIACIYDSCIFIQYCCVQHRSVWCCAFQSFGFCHPKFTKSIRKNTAGFLEPHQLCRHLAFTQHYNNNINNNDYTGLFFKFYILTKYSKLFMVLSFSGKHNDCSKKYPCWIEYFSLQQSRIWRYHFSQSP